MMSSLGPARSKAEDDCRLRDGWLKRPRQWLHSHSLGLSSWWCRTAQSNQPRPARAHGPDWGTAKRAHFDHAVLAALSVLEVVQDPALPDLHAAGQLAFQAPPATGGTGRLGRCRGALFLGCPVLVGSEAELSPIRDGATDLLESALQLCIIVPDSLDHRGPCRLGVAHIGAASGHAPREHEDAEPGPNHGSLGLGSVPSTTSKVRRQYDQTNRKGKRNSVGLEDRTGHRVSK